MKRRAWLTGVGICFIFLTWSSAEPAVLKGWVQDQTETEVNRFVPDPLMQLDAMSYVGDYMGFNIRSEKFPNESFRDVSYVAPGGNHWQSVQRLMTPANSQYMVLSRSCGKEPAWDYSNTHDMAVVKFGSRTERNGYRFRSNRLEPDEHPNDTPPPVHKETVNNKVVNEPDDVAVLTFKAVPCLCAEGSQCNTEHKTLSDGTSGLCLGNKSPVQERYDHAGGAQAIGDFLVIPVRNGEGATSQLALLDFRNPLDPMNIYQLDLGPDGGDPWAAGIVKLANGRYLLVVMVNHDGIKLWWYLSEATSLCNPIAGVCQGPGFKFWGEYPWTEASPQNITLLTDQDGQLYLWSSDSNADINGDDFLTLWRVDIDFTSGATSYTYNGANLTKLLDKQSYCSFRGDSNQCDFAAAAGLYIDPDGRLLVYATEHDNGGPSYLPTGSVRMMEFRNAGDPGPTVVTEKDAWVELFADPDFHQNNQNSAKLMIDYADFVMRNVPGYADYTIGENYADFRQIGVNDVWSFNDNISSLRWNVPAGLEMVFYADPGRSSELFRVGCGYAKYQGTTYYVPPTNFVNGYSFAISFLGSFYGHNIGNDKISSCNFVMSPPSSMLGILNELVDPADIREEVQALPKAVKNSYRANLKKVREFVDDDRIIPAIEQVEAFIQKVKTDITHDTIDHTLGELFIRLAEHVLQGLQR